MRIGVPKEIKNHEYRVGLTPAGAAQLAAAGHEVRIQAGAGASTGYTDMRYAEAGATIVPDAAEVYASDMVVKVKEPQPSEYALMHEGLTLFCYLHLAAAGNLGPELVKSKAVAVAYETVTNAEGELPLLIPMSQVAGRLAVQAGAWALMTANGGRGILLSGVPGVPPARVVILGGGVVGANAARIAVGLGADVMLLDRSPARLRRLEEVFGSALKTCHSDPHSVQAQVIEADLVIGAVLIPGKRAPKLISRQSVRRMQPGSVLVDVSIDQGGCSETSRPTTHSDPVYMEEGVVHYCVTNMPSATARTSTLALTQATLPYVLRLANFGYREAMKRDRGLMQGLQIHRGQVTHPGVAEDLGLPYVPAEEIISGD